MYSIISNTIRVFDYTKELYNWVYNNLKVRNPEHLQMTKRGNINAIKRNDIPYFSNVYVCRDNYIEMPFGVLNAIWEPFLKWYPYQIKFNSTEDISIKDVPCPWKLYSYQEAAVSEMVRKKGGILVSKCGSGKSLMGIEIIHRIGKKFLWLTHTKSLLEQTYNAMKNMYPYLAVGKVMEGKYEFGEDGTVATVQSLSRLNPSLYKDKFEVIVCDECAHVVGSEDTTRAFSTILNNIPARYKYGLTATPKRSDTLINTMYAYLGMTKNGFTPTYKVSSKDLKTIPATHIKFEVTPDLSKEKKYKIIKNGKINYTGLINFLSNDESRNDAIVNNVKQLNEQGRTQILLCHRVNHCFYLFKKLEELGLPVALITGKTFENQRNNVINRKTDWNVLVATYSLLKEGISINELDTLHLVTPQVDPSTTIQCAGRIERFVENKLEPLIFDYVDSNISYCQAAFERRSKAIAENRYEELLGQIVISQTNTFNNSIGETIIFDKKWNYICDFPVYVGEKIMIVEILSSDLLKVNKI